MFEERRRILVLEHFAFDPVELDLHLIGDAAVGQRLDQRLIGVLHAGIFADDGDGHVAFRRYAIVGRIAIFGLDQLNGGIQGGVFHQAVHLHNGCGPYLQPT